jgi:hypothetical protein
MEFGPMLVQVRILVSSEPTTENLESMRAAAKALTNDARNISTTIQRSEVYHELVANFTVKRTAQYKIADEIANEFKFHTWNFQDYQDMIISFPKTSDRTKSRRKK